MGSNPIVMKKIEVVSIIGVGMIGGSVGMALRKRNFATKIIGIGRNHEKLKKAKSLGAIDEGYTDFKQGLYGAEIVIIATPVGLIPKMVRKAVSCLKDGSIITDVGSVKGSVIREIEKFLPRNFYFVGGHPIAGSESSGVDNAKPNLFQGANCILTPTSNTNQKALNTIRKMWQEVGARVLVTDPAQHDKLLAFTSHLPHLVAISLIEVLYNLNIKNMQCFVGTGFRDITRISSGSPEMWKDICVANKKEILNALKKFRAVTNQIEEVISNEKWDTLLKKLICAKKERDSLVL